MKPLHTIKSVVRPAVDPSEQASADELLVLRAMDGCEPALADLVVRWHGAMLRQARLLTDDADSAAEVVQEAWVAIVRGLRRLRDPASFSGWAMRIVRHKAADRVRRCQRDRAGIRRLARTQPSDPASTPASPADLPSHQDRDDELATLRSAMRTLPADQRALLAMHYLDSLPLRAIAQALGIPRGTVKSRLFAARRELRQALDRSHTPHERTLP